MSFMWENDNREVANNFISNCKSINLPLTEIQKLKVKDKLRFGKTSGIKYSIEDGISLEYAQSANPVGEYAYDVKITTIKNGEAVSSQLIEPWGDEKEVTDGDEK